MEDDAPHLSAKQVGVVPVETYEGAAVERDLVGKRATVLAAASGERYALVETEQRLPWGRFLFDHDLDVRHVSAQIRRQRVDRVLCVVLEPLCRIEVIACHSASKPAAATNAESNLHSAVLPLTCAGLRCYHFERRRLRLVYSNFGRADCRPALANWSAWPRRCATRLVSACWSGKTSVMAVPLRPARPVRPVRCT